MNTETAGNTQALLSTVEDLADDLVLIPVQMEYDQEAQKKLPNLPKGWQNKTWTAAQLRRKIERGEINALAADVQRSALVVVDVDSKKPECNFDEFIEEREQPETWIARTPTGGKHYYYHNPDHQDYASLKDMGVKGVDIQNKALIFLPGSEVPGVGVYSWATDIFETALARPPSWLVPKADQAKAIDPAHAAGLLALRRGADDDDDLIQMVEGAANDGIDRDDWLAVGMGLHFEYAGTDLEDRARDAFLEWTSRRDGGEGKRNMSEARKTWDSFPPPEEVVTRNHVTGGSVAHLLKPGKVEAKPEAKGDDLFQALDLSVLDNLPPRQWVYGRDMIKDYITLLLAQGIGKTSLLIMMAVAMATGRPLLGVDPVRPRRVLLWSGEDNRVEVYRKVKAAMIHFGVTQEQIGDRLIIATSENMPIDLAFENASNESGQPRVATNMA